MTLAPRPSPPPAPPKALVRGAGPSGTLAALALADAGWSVTLVDPAPPERLLASQRAYAFTHSSRRLLQRLGLWQRLSPVLLPFTALDLADLGCRRVLRFGSTDLWGASPGEEPVGWIGEHSQVMEVLLEALAAQGAIHPQLGPGPHNRGPRKPGAPAHDASATVAGPVDPVDVDLVVAADGSLSPTREGLGIGTWRHAYAQHCLTAQVTLSGAPAGTAWEQLRTEGPFAVLPMARGRFQVVWSAPGWRCRQLESLSPVAFLDALAPVLPAGIDVASLEEPPRVFPVQWQLARRLHQGRTILVGETAHRCHPVGGQGLNLSLRDVAVLHRLAQRARAGRLPLDRLAASYARRRWPDLFLTLLLTDGLVRCFSNRHPLLLVVRRMAIGLCGKAPVLRRCLLGVMTNGPCQPFQTAPT